MTRCRYQGVVTLGLLIAFGPVAADAQEPVQDSSEAPRLSLLSHRRRASEPTAARLGDARAIDCRRQVAWCCWGA